MQSVHTKEGIRENPLGTHFYSSIHSRITYGRRGSAVSLPSFPGKAAIICEPVITPLPHSSTPTPATTPCTHSRAGNTLQQVPAAKLLLWLDRGKVCEDGLSGGLGEVSFFKLSVSGKVYSGSCAQIEGLPGRRGETMLDPSSSEEESEDFLDEERRDVLVVNSGGGGGRSSQGAPRDPRDPSARSNVGRPASPSPSVSSEGREEYERLQREEKDRRNRLQLYVYIMRCIAYPFNAKQPTDMTRRQQKLNKQQLQTIRERFQAFLNGETQIVADEAFCNAVRSYFESFRLKCWNSNQVRRHMQKGVGTTEHAKVVNPEVTTDNTEEGAKTHLRGKT
ncbi:calcium-dependent secretion activator 2 isoform X1 [Pelobates cultripes]|uniref:Calcium-dependent secretion activator 2 isoform X1 n=1 Tax=Pelobates cultripes TaxID=61616 RepID=A0AAD1RUR6_PELCU|nr:calcium-dependent secretion activator 2 isoform X1 [Pelobates cultripes]